MSTVIRLKENEALTEMFDILQSTAYYGLGKTEILRSLMAEKTWQIKSGLNGSTKSKPINTNKGIKISSKTNAKLKKALASHKDGKSITVKYDKIEDFLENYE